MTQPHDDPPLGPDDFDAQDAVLDALRERDPETPDWEFCDGFLAAVVCCRRPVEAHECWPALFGPAFRPMEQMEFVWRWHRRVREVTAALDADVETLEDERPYQPEVLDERGGVLALPAEERGDIDVDQLPPFGRAWALGFLHGVSSFADEWASPRDPDAAAMLDDALAAIEALLEPDRGVPALSMAREDGPPSISEERLARYGDAVWAVYDLRQLWKSLGPRVQAVRKAPEPGRNDPCPCGSGKKFKKCHGA